MLRPWLLRRHDARNTDRRYLCRLLLGNPDLGSRWRFFIGPGVTIADGIAGDFFRFRARFGR